MTTKYRYIGKGTTDSNGIAHMTEDADGQSCNGYTGTGKGLTDIIASTDDSSKISDSSILSEICSVWDYIVYDGGVTGDKSSSWTVHDSEISTDENGTLIDKKGEYTSTILINGDFEAVFEATNVGAFRFGVVDGSNRNALAYTGNYRYYKMKRVNGVFTFQRSQDNSNWSNITGDSTTITTEDVYFLFRVLENSRSLTYKNLKIYRI